MKNKQPEIIYRYIRKKTRDILDGEDLILILVDVRKIHTVRRFNKESTKVISGGLYQNEFTVDDQPDYIKDLPFGRYAIEISEEEFEYLSLLSQNDVQSFIRYIKRTSR
ncbi:hypothetical protein [Lysinibacillus sphaericus]|uniref:Uncharacterized protein n=2 Tax=Lysinibacillus sphaericus TaxID=1421 RepID=A0A6H0A0E3_LYSSH|nr:hypothetical protein [Lysinibacillus sphaericus]MBE5085664.1 hypothetical protein [Bacillus thuringiensis]ACA42327.1 hypothetical protein Bsph_p097 [Lysinibacillus sphaericus C3-41]AMO35298.1 hypothetical protein AR327_22670 [Lysinibacillus sphaericus]AMO35468.1 hypothetical protein AR327_23540 [Lysinibacillus sphaericus]AMR93099.1 hypothetical protein A1T07_23115 [Lysinibacillus sphaericus]